MKSPIALLLFLGALCAPVLGQSPSASKAEHQNSDTSARFDFNFSGGTVSELIAAISAVDKSPINVTLGSGAGEIKVPKLIMVNVTTDEVLQSLGRLSESDRSLGRWGQVDRNNWIITLLDRSEQMRTGVVYVGQLLKKYKIEDIAAAITFALNSPDRPQQTPPKLRLHKETSLLIFEVSFRDFDTVMQVLSQLKESASP